MKRNSLLLLVCGIILSSYALAQSESIPSAWTRGDFYYRRPFPGYLCQSFARVADNILYSVEARNVQVSCRNNNEGNHISFKILKALPENREGSVAGYWMPISVSSWSEGNNCSYDGRLALDLLDEMGVRNLEYSIMCNGQNGHLQFSFEALVPNPDGEINP